MRLAKKSFAPARPHSTKSTPVCGNAAISFRSPPRKRRLSGSAVVRAPLDSRLRGNERKSCVRLLQAGAHIPIAQTSRHGVKPGLERAARGAVLERLLPVRQIGNDLRGAGDPGPALF